MATAQGGDIFLSQNATLNFLDNFGSFDVLGSSFRCWHPGRSLTSKKSEKLHKYTAHIREGVNMHVYMHTGTCNNVNWNQQLHLSRR